jgi:hypothetical protein
MMLLPDNLKWPNVLVFNPPRKQATAQGKCIVQVNLQAFEKTIDFSSLALYNTYYIESVIRAKFIGSALKPNGFFMLTTMKVMVFNDRINNEKFRSP